MTSSQEQGGRAVVTQLFGCGGVVVAGCVAGWLAAWEVLHAVVLAPLDSVVSTV